LEALIFDAAFPVEEMVRGDVELGGVSDVQGIDGSIAARRRRSDEQRGRQ
jgi:hypothetical protein